MVGTLELQKLLREFNTGGYADAQMASETAKYISNGKGGLILRTKNGSFSYEDEFYGGQPYSGNETIWQGKVAIFRCVYLGVFREEVAESFLRKALAQGPTGNCVHRGPESFVEGDLEYRNGCVGTLDEFRQTERIYKAGKEIYVGYFYGGRVNSDQINAQN